MSDSTSPGGSAAPPEPPLAALDLQEGGFRWAYCLDSPGVPKGLSWGQVQAWKPEDGCLWVHLNRTEDDAKAWLRSAQLEQATCDALLAEETRPRSFLVGDGLLLILRGVNLNPGAEPDDMIALRIWADSKRLITLRQRRLLATQDVARRIEQGKGPRDVPSLLIQLASGMAERMEPVLENLEALTDGIEAGLTTREARLTRGELAELRRQIIAIRRHLSPQRMVLTKLAHEEVTWLDLTHRGRLRELGDRTTRHVEDLEALRERAGVIHDELVNHVAEELNSRMYVLSLVAAIFLPLGLLTGLLGINVGGMPGADDSTAFWLVCALLVALGLAIAWVLRWRRWI